MGTFMVFCPPVALWYGENVAGEDLPEGMRDISEMTINQVGTWTWSWMGKGGLGAEAAAKVQELV